MRYFLSLYLALLVAFGSSDANPYAWQQPSRSRTSHGGRVTKLSATSDNSYNQVQQPAVQQSSSYASQNTPVQSSNSYNQQVPQLQQPLQQQQQQSYGSDSSNSYNNQAQQPVVQSAVQQQSYGSVNTPLQSASNSYNQVPQQQLSVSPLQQSSYSSSSSGQQSSNSYNYQQVQSQPVQVPVQVQQSSYAAAAPKPTVVEVPLQSSNSYYQQQSQPSIQIAPIQNSNSYYQPQQVQPSQIQPALSVQQPGYGSAQVVQNTPLRQLSCSDRPCLNEGVCEQLGSGTFACKCPWGFTGARCEICLTDCASNPCSPNKVCKAKFGGGFECVCPANRAGVNCEIQNDLCAANPCLNGGSCQEVIGGSFVCNCAKPWAGNNCEKLWQNPCTDEVLRSSEVQQFKNPWDRHGFLICVDKNVYHPMKCSVGTYFNENLHHCVPEGYDPPKCPSGFCLNDGECLVDEKNQLKCICKSGFSGDRCAVNIDECASEGNAACSGGVCVDQVNGYYCRCPNGGIGLNCQQTIQNPCTAENLKANMQFFDMPSAKGNVYLHCTAERAFEVRKCADNLYWHHEEQTCTVERPPLKSGICLTFPCKNGGECNEGGSSGFTCTCKSGYTGVLCDQMIDYCASNPCQNEGKCVSYAGGYTCICPNKIIDDCCCHGILNPCPPRRKIIPGVNNYFEHLNKHRYIHCDFDGRAFVRSCAPGTNWNQKVLTCTPEKFAISDDTSQSYAPSQSSYGQAAATPSLEISSAPQGSYQQSYQPAQPAVELNKPIQVVQQQPSQSYQQSYQPAQQVVQISSQPVVQQSSQGYQQPSQGYQQPSQGYQQQSQGYQQTAPSQPVEVSQPIVQQQQPSQGYQQSYQSAAQPVEISQPVVQQSSQSYQQNYQSYQPAQQVSQPVEISQPVVQQPSQGYQQSYQQSYQQTAPSQPVEVSQPIIQQQQPSQGYQQSYQSPAQPVEISQRVGQRVGQQPSQGYQQSYQSYQPAQQVSQPVVPVQQQPSQNYQSYQTPQQVLQQVNQPLASQNQGYQSLQSPVTTPYTPLAQPAYQQNLQVQATTPYTPLAQPQPIQNNQAYQPSLESSADSYQNSIGTTTVFPQAQNNIRFKSLTNTTPYTPLVAGNQNNGYQAVQSNLLDAAGAAGAAGGYNGNNQNVDNTVQLSSRRRQHRY